MLTFFLRLRTFCPFFFWSSLILGGNWTSVPGADPKSFGGEYATSGAYSEFFLGRDQFLLLFQAYFFPAGLILNNLSTKNDSREVQSMLPRKFVENLHTVMAVLVLFEQFLGKVCSYFWPLPLSA